MLIVAHVILCACAIASAYFWGRRAHSRPWWFALWAVGAVVAGVVVFYGVPLSRIWGVATPLREGGTLLNAESLLGKTPSNGPNFLFYVSLIRTPDTIPLIRVVQGNIALSVATAFGLSAVATKAYRSLWAPVVVLGGCYATPLFRVGAASELPGPLLGAYFLLGAVCVAAATTSEAAKYPEVRLRGAIGVTAAAYVAGQTRLDVLVIGLPAAGIAWAYFAFGGEKVQGWAASLRAMAVRVVRAVGGYRSTALVIVAAALLSRWGARGIADPYLRSAVRGLNPLDPSVLTLPFTIGPAVTVGGVVLMLFGLYHLSRRWLCFGALPFAFLVLFKVHFASAHNGEANFELLRYQTFWPVVIGFFAVWGGVEIVRVSRSRFVSSYPGLALALGLTALCTTWPGPHAHVVNRAITLVPGQDGQRLGGWAGYDVQKEIMFLARTLDERPECAVVVPYAERSSVETEEGIESQFGINSYLVLQKRGRLGLGATNLPASALSGYIADRHGACVLYYEGLDCHILDGPECPSVPEGAQVHRDYRFRARHWGEPYEWGPYDETIDLTFYSLSARDTPVNQVGGT